MRLRWIVGAGIFTILIHLLPYLVYGENAYVAINDNLDGSFFQYVVLAQSHKIFTGLDEYLPQVMNGLPRNVLPSELNVTTQLFAVFSPFTAYVINQFFIRVVAFAGMFLLLRLLFGWNRNQGVVLLVSASFASLPFLTFGGSSIATQSLAVYALITINRHRAKLWHWMLLILIPLFSSLPLAYIFFIIAAFGFFVFDSWHNKKCNWQLLIGIIIFCLGFILVEYRTFYNTFFNPNYVSHRSEFTYEATSLTKSLQETVVLLIYGQYHTNSAHTPVILITLFLAFLKAKMKERRLLLKMGLSIVMIALIYGFRHFSFALLLQEKIRLLQVFDASRFYWLLPLIWYVAFALGLVIIARQSRRGKIIVLTLLSVQLLFLFYKHEHWVGGRTHQITYRNFFAAPLFSQIKDYIGKPPNSYRIANVGLHPSIAVYNGFYTLDFYTGDYPLWYKHAFREIIAPQLAENEELRKKFDNWGSRCYILLTDLTLTPQSKELYQNYIIKNFPISTTALKQLGATYILSAAKIDKPEQRSLELLKIFSHEESHWTIYLYLLK